MFLFARTGIEETAYIKIRKVLPTRKQSQFRCTLASDYFRSHSTILNDEWDITKEIMIIIIVKYTEVIFMKKEVLCVFVFVFCLIGWHFVVVNF